MTSEPTPEQPEAARASLPSAPRTVSGKRIILFLVGLLALWGIVLAVLVWRAANAPHHTRVREAAGERR